MTSPSDSNSAAFDFQNKTPTIVIVFRETSAGLEYNFTRPGEIKSTRGNVHIQVNISKICSVVANCKTTVWYVFKKCFHEAKNVRSIKYNTWSDIFVLFIA